MLVWEVGEQDGDVDTQRLSDQCTLFDGDAVFTAFNASIVGAADLTNFSELFLAATAGRVISRFLPVEQRAMYFGGGCHF